MDKEGHRIIGKLSLFVLMTKLYCSYDKIVLFLQNDGDNDVLLVKTNYGEAPKLIVNKPYVSTS